MKAMLYLNQEYWDKPTHFSSSSELRDYSKMEKYVNLMLAILDILK
jgi:hypothetical protein